MSEKKSWRSFGLFKWFLLIAALVECIPTGFLVDEEKKSLGTRLTLPEWLESQRTGIESLLRPIHTR